MLTADDLNNLYWLEFKIINANSGRLLKGFDGLGVGAWAIVSLCFGKLFICDKIIVKDVEGFNLFIAGHAGWCKLSAAA